jgi:transglutaminase-like putative cysteine protease
MKLRVGFEMHYEFPQPTPMIMVLGTHFTRASDIIVPDYLTTSPSVPVAPYRDMFGNRCSRIVAPAGHMRLAADGIINDSGLPDPVQASAAQHLIEDLPSDALVYLLGSRYCETDRLSDIAWKLFERTPLGWQRVQAICDFAHHHIAFGYEHARATKTAWEAHSEGKGVCRDYAHLANRILPLHEHPGALLHGISQRHRHAAALGRRGFRGLVRGLYRRTLADV